MTNLRNYLIFSIFVEEINIKYVINNIKCPNIAESSDSNEAVKNGAEHDASPVFE